MIPRLLDTARANGAEILADALGLAAICVMIVGVLLI